ncbi:TetR/AcrR family transcriptional regulator [Thermopolyspora sp. NPDC052614]|uniref:TetR/AcrR family transcriptional regulator n=1 Tax=Thermopolyspora sp. NPDC052614 TaxID=3155682 RepID=UPI0034221380
MARTVDQEAHAARREEFLDAASRLIQTKGYTRMSIQDVIDAVGASRGAFYHYFGSKTALLEGVVQRMVETGTAALAPVVEDPRLPALEKLNAVFSGLATYKTERKDLIIALVSVWASDENVLMREKFYRAVIARMTPLIAAIVRQGVAEGSFTPGDDPDATALVFATLVMGANQTAMNMYTAHRAGAVTVEEIVAALAAFGTAFERLLGIRPGTFGLPDYATVIREWIDAFDTASPAQGGTA